MSRRYPHKEPPIAAPGRFLVVDLEATTDRGGIAPDAREAIEIGAVLVDADAAAVLQTFQTFVRPVEQPVLTPFCAELTSITQAQVDGAPSWPDAIADLEALAAGADTLFCSWGGFDRRLVERESARHGLPYGMPPHWNLAGAFSGRVGVRRRFGLRAALDRAGLSFEGTPHRALDDARNTARLLPWCLGRAAFPPLPPRWMRRQADRRAVK